MRDLKPSDLGILKVLQRDGSLANDAVGEAVNRSGSAVSRRITALKEAKVITGIHAAIDPAKLGLKTTVYTLVALKSHGDGITETFGQVIEQWPNVIEWSQTSGSWDFLLKILVRDTQEHDALHYKLLLMPEVSRVRGMHVIGSPHIKPIPLG